MNNSMISVLVMWPPKIEYVFSIQKHFTTFGETISYLRQHRDLTVEAMDGSALLYFQWDFITAYSKQFDFVVIYTDLHNSISAIKAAQQCKDISPNSVTISYGPGTPYAPRTFLEHGFDASIIDPMYQKSILDFILFKSGRLQQTHLKGIVFTHNDTLVEIPETYPLNVGEVAYPALDMIPVERYKQISGRDQICFTVGRGCTFACRFCRVPLEQGHTLSHRPVPDIIRYVAEIMNDFQSVKFEPPSIGV